MTHVELLILAHAGRAGVALQLVRALPFAEKLEGVTEREEPQPTVVPVDVL
jgi:hypothetical protein